MEQNPVPGHDALAPPDADIARRYLDEAQAVSARRDIAVDRRALAWLEIANAVILAVYFWTFAGVIHIAGTMLFQSVLFTLLVWSQLSTGMTQRHGLQWRLTRARLPVYIAAGLLLVVTLTIFAVSVLQPDAPIAFSLLPGILVLAGLGGAGAVKLVRARNDPRPQRIAPSPLPRLIRVGTILVGVAIGVLILLIGAPAGVVTGVLLVMVGLPLLVWILAARSEMGLPAIGAAWRWPHVLAFGIAGATLLAAVSLQALSPPEAADARFVGTAIAGAAVAALFVAVSFVPGRGPRE